MTLVRQLIFAVVLLFVVLYAGNVVVSLFNTQTLVDEQMRVHAQDTATAVAISMTQAAQQNDIATLDTLFNAVSDSGFYQRIYFTNLDGKTVIDREFPVDIQGVPDWFVHLVPLSSKEGRAEVNSGWLRLGNVVVASHPGKAYAELWSVMLDQLLWFFIVTLLVCGAAYTALRWLLVPLNRVEQQADAICQQDFRIQDQLPRTRELRRVVQAMNRMSARLQSIFEGQLELIKRLQYQAYKDPVTGLSNRAEFDARLETLSEDSQGTHSGAVVLVGLSDISAINQKLGREWGNKLLRDLGQLIQVQVSPFDQAVVARRQGLEFAVLLVDVSSDSVRALVQSLFVESKSLVASTSQDIALTVALGFSFQSAVSEPKSLLIEADIALKDAAVSGDSRWQEYMKAEADVDHRAVRSVLQWQEFIHRQLETRTFNLLSQSVFQLDSRAVVGSEVFSRFDDNGQAIAPALVLAHAEQLGMAADVDRKVIELLASQVVDGSGYVSVNLSVGAITAPTFAEWLAEFLGQYPAFGSQLVCEIPESIVHSAEASVRFLQNGIQGLGARIGIDNFGLQSSSFSYLRSLPLAYLKVHRSFTAGIESNPDNQFYIKSLLQLANSRDIPLIAEGVETQAQLDTLQSLGIEYVQGFYLSLPQPV